MLVHYLLMSGREISVTNIINGTMVEQITADNYQKMIKVQSQRMDELFSKKHVVGVAIGCKRTADRDTGELAIIIMVDRKVPRDLLGGENIIPEKLDEFATDVMEVGKIVANRISAHSYIDREKKQPVQNKNNYFQFFEDADRSALEMDEHFFKPRKYNSTPTGEAASFQLLYQQVKLTLNKYPTINFDCTDGNMSGISDHPSFILDNYHVIQDLTHSISEKDNSYSRNPGLVQNFVPIRFKTPGYTPINYVDAAIADFSNFNALFSQKNNDTLTSNSAMSDHYLKNRPKYLGHITALNATVDVTYDKGKTARFSRQIITTKMGEIAHHGALLTDQNQKIIGLPFAHSSTVTVINDLQFIEALLKVRIH